MKKSILYFMAFCSFSSALAGAGPQSLTTGVVIGNPGFPHFTPDGGKITDITNFRLVAKVSTLHDSHSFVILDSIHYKYSNGRGGLINIDRPQYDETLLFDEATTFKYNNWANSYTNKLLRTQDFTSDNNIQLLKYAVWQLNNQVWKDSARYWYKYVAGTNKIEETTLQLWVGGTWSHNVPSTLVYDGNKVVSVNSNAYSTIYTYDANNNIISITDKAAIHGTGILNNTERKSYSYNSDNLPVTYTLEQWDKNNSTWVKAKYFEYTYQSKNVSESIEYNWNNGNWNLHAKHVFTYDAADNKTSETTQLWNGNTYINSIQQLCKYNQAGLVESITTISWNTATMTWQPQANNTQIRYYYEYFAPTSVTNTTNNTTLTLYPIPANNVIHVSGTTYHSQSVSFYVTSANGAVLKNWEETLSGNYDIAIPTDALPVGTYTLYASGKEINLSKKFTIIR